MESEIECAYEEVLSRIQLLGRVHDTQLHRLSIIEPYGDYEHLPLTYPKLLSDFPVSTD